MLSVTHTHFSVTYTYAMIYFPIIVGQVLLNSYYENIFYYRVLNFVLLCTCIFFFNGIITSQILCLLWFWKSYFAIFCCPLNFPQILFTYIQYSCLLYCQGRLSKSGLKYFKYKRDSFLHNCL